MESSNEFTSFPSECFDSTIADDSLESHCSNTQSSALSSTPTDLLTPNEGSNPAERSMSYSDELIPQAYKKRKKVRQGYCWLPCNGQNFTASNGTVRWHCMRCKHQSVVLTLLDLLIYS
jgi:hypothetical protein